MGAGQGDGGGPWRGLARGLGLGIGIGVPFGVLVSFGALAGRSLDARFESEWFTVAGIVLGAVAAFLNMFRVLSHFQRLDESAPEGRDGHGGARPERRKPR